MFKDNVIHMYLKLPSNNFCTVLTKKKKKNSAKSFNFAYNVDCVDIVYPLQKVEPKSHNTFALRYICSARNYNQAQYSYQRCALFTI